MFFFPFFLCLRVEDGDALRLALADSWRCSLAALPSACEVRYILAYVLTYVCT
jgi:hypothetical protein